MHTLLTVLVALLIVGVLLWGVEAMPAIDANIKGIIRIVLIVAVVIWLASLLLGHGSLRL